MTYVLVFPMKVNEKNKHHLRFNLAELISESQKAYTIEEHLRYVALMIELNTPPHFQLIHEIVVDWSWAEIHAILRSFNNMSPTQYLDLAFEIIKNEQPEKLKGVVMLLQCSSHLTKRMKSCVDAHFIERKTKKVVYEILGAIFQCQTWLELVQVMHCFIRIFSYPFFDSQIKEDLKVIESLKRDINIEVDDDANSTASTEDFNKEDEKQIFKSSPFYQVSRFIRLCFFYLNYNI